MRMDKRALYGKIATRSTSLNLSLNDPEYRMSHHDHHHAESAHEPDPADSRADAIAAFFAIAIAVTGVLYFISQQ